LTTLTLDEAVKEIDGGKSLIEDALQLQITSFAYPFGKHQPWLYPLVSRHHQHARTASTEVRLIETSNNMVVPAWEIFPDSTVGTLVRTVTLAAEAKHDLVLVFHGFAHHGYRPLETRIFREFALALRSLTTQANVRVTLLRELRPAK